MSVIIQSAKNFVPLPPDASHIKMLLREIDECLYTVTSKGNIVNLSEYNSDFYRIPVDEAFADNISEESVLASLDHEIGYRCLILSSGNIFEITIDENGNKYWMKEPLQGSGCMLFIKDDNMLDSYYLYNGQTWDRINHNITGMHLVDFNNPHCVTAFQVGLGYVKNVLQATQVEFDTHVATSNVHRVTKDHIGFPHVPNVLQCTFEEYLEHITTGKDLNPHRYDKESVGLENVDNYLQASVEDFEIHISKENNPHHVTLVQVGLDEVLNISHESNDNLVAHTGNKNNPHRTNQSQIEGLEKIINIVHASKTDFDNHVGNSKAHGINKEQVGLGNVINEKQVTKVDFNKHVENKNNPHGTTKEDVGLGNVINKKQAKKADLENHLSQDNPHKITKRVLGLSLVENFYQVSEKELKDHVDNHNNPHKITKEDVGLGNVPNIVQASGVDVGDHITKTGNPHGVTKADVDLGNVENKKQISTDIFQEHAELSRNPHGVTKESIGNLENVENTSDLEKIISDAQLAELEKLQEKLVNGFNIVNEKEGDIKFAISESVVNTPNSKYLQYYGKVNSMGIVTDSPFNDEYTDNSGSQKQLSIFYLANNYQDFKTSIPSNCLPYIYVSENFNGRRFLEYELRIGDMIIFENDGIRVKINNNVTNVSSVNNSLIKLFKDESLQTVENPDFILKILSLLKYNVQKYPTFKATSDSKRQGNDTFMKFADFYRKIHHKNLLFDFSSVKETNNYRVTGITGKHNKLYWSEVLNDKSNILNEEEAKLITNETNNEEYSIIKKDNDNSNKIFSGIVNCNSMVNAIVWKSNDGSSPIHDGDMVFGDLAYNLDSVTIYDFDNNKIKVIFLNQELFGRENNEQIDNNKLNLQKCINYNETLAVKIKNDNAKYLKAVYDANTGYVTFSIETSNFPPFADENHLSINGTPIELYFTDASVDKIIQNQNSILFENCGYKRIIIHPLYYKLFYSEYDNLSCNHYESWTDTGYRYDVTFNIKGKGIIKYNNTKSQNRPITTSFIDKISNISTYFDYAVQSGNPLTSSKTIDYKGLTVANGFLDNDTYGICKNIKNPYFTTFGDRVEFNFYDISQKSSIYIYNRFNTSFNMQIFVESFQELGQIGYDLNDIKNILILPENKEYSAGFGIVYLNNNGSILIQNNNSVLDITSSLPDTSSKAIAICYLSDNSIMIYKENGSLIIYSIYDRISQIIDKTPLNGEKVFYIKSYLNFVLLLSYDPDSEDDKVTISYYDILSSKIVNTHQRYNFGKDRSKIKSFLSKGKRTGYIDSHKIGDYLDIVGESYGISIPINYYNGYFFQNFVLSDGTVYSNCSNDLSGYGEVYPLIKLANYGDINNESYNFFNNVLENLMNLSNETINDHRI